LDETLSGLLLCTHLLTAPFQANRMMADTLEGVKMGVWVLCVMRSDGLQKKVRESY